MQKFFTIAFLSIYSFSIVGMNVMIHTCSGESTSSLVTVEVKDPCACGDEMPAADMCCTTEIKTVKVDDSQLTAVQEILTSQAAVDILPAETISTNLLQNSAFVVQNFTDTSPPSDKDFQASNSIFLI